LVSAAFMDDERGAIRARERELNAEASRGLLSRGALVGPGSQDGPRLIGPAAAPKSDGASRDPTLAMSGSGSAI
jgi:hypothetical protein